MPARRPPRPRMDASPRLLLLAAALLLLPGEASARQEVRGLVSEDGSGAPVAGAMVVLLLDGERAVARALTGGDGAYRIAAPRPGRYELRVDRIGFASAYSGPFEVRRGEDVERNVESRVEAVVLTGIDVTADRRCEVRPEEGRATALVWEEARKALAAAEWTAERGMYRFAWTRFVRDLAADGRRVLSEDRTVRRDLVPQPFRSVEAEVLVREGFLHDAGEGLRYLAPDQGVLLSDAFLDTHCFALETGPPGVERLIGLRFEPIPGRRQTEIDGVLWLGAETGRLRSIEYRYLNLPWRLETHDAGGELFLRGLPNGTWIVHEWRIRMPRLREERDRDGALVRHEALGYREEGGVVGQVTTLAGEVVGEESGRGEIRGVVSDSLGRPAPGARVWIAGTDLVGSSGPDGRFAFPDVGAGVWSVGATHPALEAVGHAGVYAEADVERGGVRSVALALPSVRGWALERCADEPPGEATTAILGTVLDESGRPAPGAAVRALWTRGGAQEGVGADAEEGGRFLLCDVPAGLDVRTWATLGDRASGVLELAVSQEGYSVVAEIELRADTAARPAGGDREEPAAAAAREAAWLASKGFDLRAQEGALLHQSREEILRRHPVTLEDVLRQADRVEVRRFVTGRKAFVLRAAGGPGARPGASEPCELEFVLNGSLLRQRVADDVRALEVERWLDPRHLTALEVFDAETAPMAVPGGCGAVLLWVHRLEDRRDPEFTGSLRGRVIRLPDGTPVPDASVTLHPGGSRLSTDELGRFHFGRLPAARYRIEVAVPGWPPWDTEVALRAGGALDVRVEVEGGKLGQDRGAGR